MAAAVRPPATAHRRPRRCAARRVRAGRRLWCGVLLMAAALLPAQQQVTVAVRASSTEAKLPGDLLAASVAWLLGEWYGPAVAARAWTDGGTAAAAQLRLALTATGAGLQLHSELVERGRALGVRTSWLPAGSLGAVTATAAGDGFRLWSEARRFAHLHDLGAAPARTAVLPAAGLGRLVQRPVTGPDVQAAAAYPDGVLVLLADGPVALGHQFDIVPDTAAWLTWRERPPAPGGPWRSLYPLHDGRVVLEPWSGVPVVAAPEQAGGRATGPAGLYGGSGDGAPPAGALLAIAPDGSAAWHGSGELVMRGHGAAAAGTVRLPLGSLAPSATAFDGSGTLWTFDPRERRLRAFATTGDGSLRQVHAITPMLPAQELGGVQALAITAGGHFLIGSQRAVWNVDRRGMPRWALRLLHADPRQRLPQAFSLTAGVERGVFVLLDRSTGGLHRFSERPEPAPAPHLTAADPQPGTVDAAVTDSALRAAERAWRQRQPHSAALLLAAAGRSLKRWHAADPLADGVEQRSAAIEQLNETLEHALYGEQPLTPRITPAIYHPALGAWYETHPFTLTIRNRGGDRPAAAVELGIAGATSATTVPVPALAAGAETTVPVQLHAPAGTGSTGVPGDTTLWMSAAAAGSEPVLSAMPFAVEPDHCLPEQAAESPGGSAHAAFLRWHLARAAAAPVLPAPAGLPAYRLVDRLAQLATVGAARRCLQAADRTLAALSGSATDWALAIAGVLHRSGIPAALLVGGAAEGGAAGAGAEGATTATVLVIAWFEAGGDPVDRAAPSLTLPARQRLAAHLEDAAQTVPPGRVWALLPQSGAGAAAWSAAGAEAATAALATGGTRVHILGATSGVVPRRPAAASRARLPAAQPVLPLGNGAGSR